MKIKLDENLPCSLAEKLRGLGYHTDTAVDEGLGGCPDSTVWEVAQSAGRFLITQDPDFSNIRRFTPGTHHGVLLLRLPAPGEHARSPIGLRQC